MIVSNLSKRVSRATVRATVRIARQDRYEWSLPAARC